MITKEPLNIPSSLFSLFPPTFSCSYIPVLTTQPATKARNQQMSQTLPLPSATYFISRKTPSLPLPLHQSSLCCHSPLSSNLVLLRPKCAAGLPAEFFFFFFHHRAWTFTPELLTWQILSRARGSAFLPSSLLLGAGVMLELLVRTAL